MVVDFFYGPIIETGVDISPAEGSSCHLSIR